MTQSIYWRGSDVNSAEFRSVSPSHPPAWKHKSSFVSASTCLALHVPGCFVALSAHLFKESLSISLRLFIQLSLGLLLSHWWFVLFCFVFFFSCGIWDPIHGVHIVQFLSIPADGPRQAEWVTVGALLSLSTTPLCAPCHPMMSWLLSPPGVPIDFSLAITHSLYLPFPPLLHPPTNPQSCTPFYPQPVTFSNSLASQ